MRKLFNDEHGFVVSAELMLVITLMFCAAAVGWAAVRDALVNELNDVSHAIGTVSQSYSVVGLSKLRDDGTYSHGQCSGFGFNDTTDDCDCNIITYVDAAPKADPSDGDAEGTAPAMPDASGGGSGGGHGHGHGHGHGRR